MTSGLQVSSFSAFFRRGSTKGPGALDRAGLAPSNGAARLISHAPNEAHSSPVIWRRRIPWFRVGCRSEKAVPGETNMHTLICGKTGMGKSTLLKRIAVQAMQSGCGLLLLDPHGDLADQTAGLLPRRRRNDLVWFDPRQPDTAPGLNPLRNVAPHSRTVAVSSILSTMQKLWPENWGPRTSHWLRYALLALCEVRGATLVDARDLLVDEARRAWVLKQVKSEEVLRFWVKEATTSSKQFQAEAIAPPLNKLGAFISHDSIRQILTRSRPLLDAAQCMARSRVVIARLSKGVIGEDGALLLGGLLLGLFQRATMAREALPLEARAPFAVMVDEIGSFATKPFLELLAEARKYGAAVTMCTQSLAVMEPELRAGILGNVGRLVAFRAGGDDAEILEREFARRFGAQTLMHLDVGEHIVKDGARPAVIVSADAASDDFAR